MKCPLCHIDNPVGATACQSCAAPLDVGQPGAGLPGAGLPVDGEPQHVALLPGTLLYGGAYEVREVLGQGGFGLTYYGTVMESGREVAIKEFFPFGCLRQGCRVVPAYAQGGAEFEVAKKSFLEEARTLARFQHPNIVRVYAVFPENDTIYMVMEYVPGQTLEAVVAARGAIPEQEAIHYIEQIGSALETLHAERLLHRDIKPANIMVSGERAVLLDFGSARSFLRGATRNMTSLVTPGYAPLEQYGQRARYGTFTDIYALGATLYHLLTGTPPLQSTDRASGEELLSPDRVNPNVSHLAGSAVMWAMQMRVAERPQTVGDFLHAVKTGYRPRPETTPPAGADIQGHAATSAPPRAVGARQVFPPSVLETPEGKLKVAVTSRRIDWPRRCACCGRRGVGTLTIGEGDIKWEVPYCAECREHVEEAGTAEGAPALLLAAGCLIAAALGYLYGFVPFILCFLGVLLLYKSWREYAVGHVRHSLQPPCTTIAEAVTFSHREGDTYYFEFSNKDYAREFVKLNTPVNHALNTGTGDAATTNVGQATVPGQTTVPAPASPSATPAKSPAPVAPQRVSY